MQFHIRRFALVVSLAACPFVLHRSVVGAAMQVSTGAHVAEELLTWLGRAARGSEHAAPAIADATAAVRQLAKSGEEISPAVAKLIQRDIRAIRSGVQIDVALLRSMSRHPELCEDAWNLATKLGIRNVGPRVEQISADLGERAPELLRVLSTTVAEDDAVLYMRGVAGRTLSQKQMVKTANAIEKSGLSTRDMGEAWECVSRAQLSAGVCKLKSGLREGGEVVKAQFNGVHGIDGVGAAADGRPVIFEFSMYRAKVLNDTADGFQLSPGWTSAKWNEAMKVESLVAAFRRVGVDPRYLRDVSAAEAGTWSRKFVPAHESALKDSNRLRAGIGPDDLFVLGGN